MGHGKADAPQLPAPSRPSFRTYDLRALGALIPHVARPGLRQRGGQAALLMADWAQVAGAEVAALGVPRGLQAGTLTLACTGPAAMQLQMMAPALMERINTHLGRAVVQRLRFVQQVATRPSGTPARVPARGAPPLLPGQVADKLSGITDPGLRAALENLARGVYRTRDRG